MPTKTKTKVRSRSANVVAKSPREAERRALARAVKVEKSIQSLTKRLEREMRRSNDSLQTLAVDLAARARAIEAERESTAAARE